MNMYENYPWMVDTRYLGPAQVLGLDKPGNRIRVRLGDAYDKAEVWAQIAIPNFHDFFPGDKVLIIGEDPEEIYVIGLLHSLGRSDISKRELFMDGGTHARIVRKTGEQSLQVFSNKKELLFEFDEKTGKAKVNLESGDLEFVTPNGNINFVAGKDIILDGKTVGITSRSGILLGILDALGKIQSRFSLQTKQMELSSPEIEIKADQGNFYIEKSSIVGKLLTGKVMYVSWTIDRIETVVKTAVEKAQNIYKTVSELSQLKTGRMRTLVESTFHLKSKKAYLKAEEDVKVRGEKIHLG